MIAQIKRTLACLVVIFLLSTCLMLWLYPQYRTSLGQSVMRLERILHSDEDGKRKFKADADDNSGTNAAEADNKLLNFAIGGKRTGAAIMREDILQDIEPKSAIKTAESMTTTQPWPMLSPKKWREYERSNKNVSFHTNKLRLKPVSSGIRNMAKEVFDEVPDNFIQSMKNPCWFSKRDPSNLYCLPYFYLAGMPKCGTTDLWCKIIEHPDVMVQPVKEPHWWSRHSRFGHIINGSEVPSPFIGDYAKLSRPLVEYLAKDISVADKAVFGDASASTLWDNPTWRRYVDIEYRAADIPMYLLSDVIGALQPDAKIIVMLRKPSDRIYSSYRYFGDTKKTPTDFHNMVMAELPRWRQCFIDKSVKACAYGWRNVVEFGPDETPIRFAPGLYAVYLNDWLKVYPRKQIMVIRLEDWQGNCYNILPRIYTFLKLETLETERIKKICDQEAKNQNTEEGHVKSYMLNDTRTIIEDFYRPFNEELVELLGDDRFRWDDTPAK